ncbi:MAG: hypothetical protein GWO07_14785 [Candidatus Dadabacteria bacterium]|nr:hypothetical protein [Candidatus Dadabacteria bacterium]NIS09977.1 hypothetical protein [Candidatus Dadabacteria bacterium]NIY22952.1 hypothetical protein [Candidatus Dadabacteria bacterium]
MKFLVLRTDLKRKLKYIRLLVVDAGIFASELTNGGGSFGDNIERDMQSSLILDRVRVVICSENDGGGYENLLNGSGIKYISLDGLSYAEIIERLCADYGVNRTEVAFINNSESDHNVLSALNFAVATMDAPMDVKTGSYYVSNFTGSKTLGEIIQIISAAKDS